MKKFTFRLETLLKVRNMQEEEAQLKFSQAVEAYLLEKEKENALIQAQENTFNEFRNKQHEVLTVETLKNYHYFIDKIKEELYLQSKKTLCADELRMKALAELEEATQKRKLIDKLKEKQWEEYQQEVFREEQIFLDELGLRTYTKDG